MRNTVADTQVRPAAEALQHRLCLDSTGPGTDTMELDTLAIQQAALHSRIAALVTLMDDRGVRGSDLDRLGDEIATLLGRAEELRIRRAQVAARRAGIADRWLDYLDLD